MVSCFAAFLFNIYVLIQHYIVAEGFFAVSTKSQANAKNVVHLQENEYMLFVFWKNLLRSATVCFFLLNLTIYMTYDYH